MNNEVEEIDLESAPSSLSVIEAQENANVNQMVSTAKRYPRNVVKAVKNMIAMATVDQETAISMHYALKRWDAKSQSEKIIEGPSVRMAEIMASCWGNMRSATQALGHDGKVVTSQAFAHDLENNNFVAWQCQRRITGSKGQTFSDDMIVVTSNAAAALAWRNAVLKVIPASTRRRVEEAAKLAALGGAKTNQERWADALARFGKYGVSAGQLLKLLGLEKAEDVNTNDLQTLYGISTALAEGTTTVEEQFPKGITADKPHINPFIEEKNFLTSKAKK